MARWVIDSHVHFYRCYDLSLLLQSAYHNIVSRVGADHETSLVVVLGLVLTEKEVSWSELQALAQSRQPIVGQGGQWLLQRTDTDNLLTATADGMTVYLLAGRQLVTSEKLELLCLGSPNPVADPGKSMGWHLEQNPDLINIAPWGVGKWLGSRGNTVLDILASEEYKVILGDNGGRPVFWSGVSQFRAAKARNTVVWPGTDPLPLAGAEKRTGTNFISFHVSDGTPFSWESLQTTLNEVPTESTRTLASPVQFVRDQVRIRL